MSLPHTGVNGQLESLIDDTPQSNKDALGGGYALTMSKKKLGENIL